VAVYPAVAPSPAFEALVGDTPFRDRIAVRVHAGPSEIFDALYTVTLQDMKLAWLLGELRYLPARLTGHQPTADTTRPFFSSLLDNGTVLLFDDRPREIITGSAGMLHRVVDQAAVRFSNAEAFRRFDDPEYEKLFMSIRVEPTEARGELLLVLEHATVPLSRQAAARFKPYWFVIRPTGAFVSRELLKAIGRRAALIPAHAA
jgi:hypothetical protein